MSNVVTDEVQEAVERYREAKADMMQVIVDQLHEAGIYPGTTVSMRPWRMAEVRRKFRYEGCFSDVLHLTPLRKDGQRHARNGQAHISAEYIEDFDIALEARDG